LANPQTSAIEKHLVYFFEKRVGGAQISKFISHNYSAIRSLVTSKWELGKYYLQLSGLTSQNQKHKASLAHAKQALSTLKQLCEKCCHFQSIIPASGSYGRVVLKELSSLPEEFGDSETLELMREEFRQL
jgi:DNA-binding transcriptional regulator PaaX